MRVLLVGKGAREHALAWKISRSPLLAELLIWPGNAAMSGLGTMLDLSPAASMAQVAATAAAAKVDLVVCGPEGPLADGLADELHAVAIPCFGPRAAAAALEASKAFAKDVMQAAGIPTAAFVTIADADVAHMQAKVKTAALAMLRKRGGVVLKASGLAAGKGVFVCENEAQVVDALALLYGTEMRTAASTVVLEELMRGRECSYFSMLGQDGATGLGFAVDYKRLGDGDQGPNTGGMGCYVPVPWLPADAEQQVVSLVVEPLRRELARRGIDYTGCLYVGLMWTAQGPRVVEFNVRFGDPEAEVLAVYDDRDWLALMAAKAGVEVPAAALAAAVAPVTHADCAVVVIMASAGYPFGGAAEVGASFTAAQLAAANGVAVFGAAVSSHARGVRTGSGRVLAVAARAKSFDAARTRAYSRVEQLARQWTDCQFRRDIAVVTGGTP